MTIRISKILLINCLCLIFMLPPAMAVINSSGLPVPRFVSLKSEEVNVRTGPGTRYPISWIYRREGMPVEVIEEFDLWRKIRDAEGTSGWVHKSMLEGKRNALIKGKNPQLVRIDHEEDAKPVLKVEPSVIVKLVECSSLWCRIQVSGRKGWIQKKLLWGVYPEEVLE